MEQRNLQAPRPSPATIWRIKLNVLLPVFARILNTRFTNSSLTFFGTVLRTTFFNYHIFHVNLLSGDSHSLSEKNS
jgi:hypothetical protein